MRHCRAHSSQQYSAPYWDVNFQVLTTFMSRNHEFTQQWQLTPPTRKNTSCRGKTHGWERPHEEQVISSAQGEGGAPLPVGIRQFPLPWLPPINSFWDSGDHQFLSKGFFSRLYYTKRDKIPAEDRPRRQKLLLFLNRLIPQNIMSETSCLPASRKNKRKILFLYRVIQEAPTHTLWSSGREGTYIPCRHGRKDRRTPWFLSPGF